jgi:hypothetical protein
MELLSKWRRNMKVYDDDIIAIMMDVEMRIKDHTLKYNAAMKQNTEREHIWKREFERG